MTQNEHGMDFATRYSTPQGQQGLAAAELCMDVVDLLNDVEQLAGIQRKDIAAMLDVSPGRVSQVLNGDGNITVAALARFLNAMGHEAVIASRPLGPADTQPRTECSQPDPEAALIEAVEREMKRFPLSEGRMTTFAARSVEANETLPANRTRKFATR